MMLRKYISQHPPKVLIGAGIVVFLLIGATVTMVVATNRFGVSKKEETSQTSPKTEEKKVVVEERGKTSEAVEEVKTEEARSTDAQATAPLAPTTTAQNPPSTPLPPQPFAIDSVSLNGAMAVCSGGGIVLYIESATVFARNSTGGSFTWQFEVSGAWDPPAPYPMTRTIGANQVTTTLTSTYSPGFLYTSGGFVREGQSVRIHVTSPNDVASPWFTAPVGAAQSCQ